MDKILDELWRHKKLMSQKLMLFLKLNNFQITPIGDFPLCRPLVPLWGRAQVGQEQKYTDVLGEDVTIVPMKTCFELLLDVNPGASIQLDGAARLIRKSHNST